MREELPAGGMRTPPDEACVFFAANALRFADRARTLFVHLPESLRYQLVQGTILYQYWKRRVLLHEQDRTHMRCRRGMPSCTRG